MHAMLDKPTTLPLLDDLAGVINPILWPIILQLLPVLLPGFTQMLPILLKPVPRILGMLCSGGCGANEAVAALTPCLPLRVYDCREELPVGRRSPLLVSQMATRAS